MTNAAHSLGSGLDHVRSKWGWFIALGVGFLILGLIALGNVFLATIASVFYVGALMLVGGIVQIAHAFGVRGWSRFLFWFLSGLLYTLAGILVFYDPVLASATITLLIAASLVVAGLFRMWVGFHARPQNGWGWIVATGALTLLVGIMLGVAWPGSSLFFLGVLLGIDLLFQGWGFVAFGLALKGRR